MTSLILVLFNFITPPWTIYNWENNKHEAQIKYYPVIINFIGFHPFKKSKNTLGGKFTIHREKLGLTILELAIKLEINESILSNFEAEINSERNRAVRKIFKELGLPS